MDIWSEERIRLIGDVMNEHAEDLKVGVPVQIGIDEDPCNTYRASDAPKGHVTSIERNSNGMVEFTADFPDGQRKLDNFSILPNKTWQIFEGGEYKGEGEAAAEAGRSSAAIRKLKEQLDGVNGTLGLLNERVESLYRGSKTEFHGALGNALKSMCEDIDKVSKGEPPSFCIEFVQKYSGTNRDSHQCEKVEFRGVLKKGKPDEEEEGSTSGKFQGMKTEFEFPEAITYETMQGVGGE